MRTAHPAAFLFQQLLGGAGIPTWQYRWWSVSPAITWSGSKTPATETTTGPIGSLARFQTNTAGRQKARDGSAVPLHVQRRCAQTERTPEIRSAMRSDTQKGGSVNLIADVRELPKQSVTMQWAPDQTQWAEQHYDITSTTRSPARKFEPFRSQRLTGSSSGAAYHHSWANDDISALTASNLLKRYAERYSTILDIPCDNGLIGYPDHAISSSVNGPAVVNRAPPLLTGHKMEAEPWLESVYPPLGCVPELVPKAQLSVADMPASVGSSPGVGAGGLPEPNFSSGTCVSQSSVQEYSSTLYSAPYLHAVGSYNGPLLHPVATHPNLVPAYGANASPSLPTYGYPSTGYPYSPPSPSAACLSNSIAPATPLPASSMSGYSYPTPSLAPLPASVADNGSSSSDSLSKPYYSAGPGDIRSFEEFGYGGTSNSDSQSASSPLYRPAGGNERQKGNRYEQSSGATSLLFKPNNPSDSLRSLESLAQGSAASGQCFPATSCSATSSNLYSSASSHTHLCLDTHTPC
ncbi:Fidgetin [Bagarius yarrelli]|uniref:Fidgetin n=1 Tax=Bagarius yarrelli TaxID=175774 RepID=A0A556VBB6_BAGYA|nr:Fidgetin [Bagarius yarrelli]